MWRVTSAFVVDQKGWSWFFWACVVSCGLGLGFRAVFSPAKVARELRFAAARLEPDLKLNFDSAYISVANEMGLPTLRLTINQLSGFYLPDPQWPKPIRVALDRLELPVSLGELLRGRLALNEVIMKELDIVLPNPVSTIFGQLGLVQNLDKVSEEKESMHLLDSSEPSQFEVTRPRPVERVEIELIRVRGLSAAAVSVDFRDVELEVNDAGKLSAKGYVAVRAEKGQDYRGLLMTVSYQPEDRFLMGSLSGRIREGILNGRFNWDQMSQSYHLEVKLDSVPARSLMQVTQLFLDQEWKLNGFFQRLSSMVKKEAWVSLNVTVMGYLSGPKKGAQVTLSNVKMAGSSETILVPRLSHIFPRDNQPTEVFLIQTQGVEWDKWWDFFFEEPSSLIKGGLLSSVAQVTLDHLIKSEIELDHPVLMLGQTDWSAEKVLGEIISDRMQSNPREMMLKATILRRSSGSSRGMFQDWVMHAQWGKKFQMKSLAAQRYVDDVVEVDDLLLNPALQEIKFKRMILEQKNFTNGLIKKMGSSWNGTMIWEQPSSGKGVKLTLKSDDGRRFCVPDLASSVKKEWDLLDHNTWCFDFSLGQFVF